MSSESIDQNSQFHEKMDTEAENTSTPMTSLNDQEEDIRKFSIKNVRHPGGWRTHSELQRTLDLCEFVEVSFRRPDPNKKSKTGTLNCIFSTQLEAQEAYKTLSSLKLDGNPIQLEISDSFVLLPDAVEPGEVKEEVPEVEEKENEPQIPIAPEIDEEDIIAALNKQIEEDKLNWAEVEGVYELYAICDKVSANFDGLPDSILKPAMLSTLNRHYTEIETHWMRDYIQQLIQVWRREVESDEQYMRESQVVMKAPEYEPVMVKRVKKRKAENSRAGRIMLGVGALLQSTRKMMRTENGEVDIDEDDSGNIMLNGEMLSFDSWAKATRTNQPEVMAMEVVANKGGEANGKPKKEKKWLEYSDYKKFKQEQWEKKMANRKMKIMDRVRKEMEELEREEDKSAGGSEATPVDSPAPKVQKELDEGEIDSEEERKMDIKKKKRNSSDSSSSSSEESEDGPNNAASRRRRIRKMQEKKRKDDPLSNPVLKNLFDFRHQLVKQMPLDQKKLFVKTLREVVDSRGAISSDSNIYRQLSDDVNRLAH